MNLYDKISIMHVTKEMLKKHGAREEDTEEFIDYGLSIKGIETAAIIKEREDGTLKVSLRSKNNIPVQELATKYGGGGTKTASGFPYEKKKKRFKTLFYNFIFSFSNFKSLTFNENFFFGFKFICFFSPTK